MSVEFSGKIYCLGYCIMDITIQTEGFPKLGETYYSSYDYYLNSGGKGLNQAIAAARQNASVYLISVISNDTFGNKLMKDIESNRIKTTYINRSNNKSGVAIINIDKNGNNKIICTPGVNKDIELMKSFEYISFNKGDILLSTLEYSSSFTYNLFKKCKQNDVFVIADPSGIDESVDKKIFEYIDIIKPNEIESNYFNNSIENVDLTNRLINMKKMGIKIPLISLGDKGILYLDENNNEKKIAPLDVKAVDTTAAGDVFLGTLAAILSSNSCSLHEALEYAVISSGLSVTKIGASSSIPYKTDVLNYYNKIIDTKL